MSFTVIDAPQRSPEWFQARAGRLTGSAAKNLFGNKAVGLRDLKYQLVVERLTGLPQDDGNGYVNAAMQWGIDHEEDAFSAYEALTGNVTGRTGFLASVEHMAGCSLDGHVGDFDGILEIKCPKSATHWGYLREHRTLPSEYLPQVAHNLWVTGARWCDFLSFDPRFPEAMRTFYVHVTREDVDLAGYEKKALAFLAEVERELDAMRGWSVLEQQSA